MNVFDRDSSSEVFHPYSCYARSLDMRNGAYRLLDLMPKAATRPTSLHPLQHHDRYGD